MTVETKNAKNGSNCYYVREENGKLKAISREKEGVAIDAETPLANTDTKAKVAQVKATTALVPAQFYAMHEIKLNTSKLDDEILREQGTFSTFINGEYVTFKNHSIDAIDATNKLGMYFKRNNGKKQFFTIDTSNGYTVRGSQKIIAARKVADYFMAKETAIEQGKFFHDFFDAHKTPSSLFFSVNVFITYVDGVEHIFERTFELFNQAQEFVGEVKKVIGDNPTQIFIKHNQQGGKLFYHRQADGTEIYDLPENDFEAKLAALKADCYKKAAKRNSARAALEQATTTFNDADQKWTNAAAAVNNLCKDKARQLTAVLDTITSNATINIQFRSGNYHTLADWQLWIDFGNDSFKVCADKKAGLITNIISEYDTAAQSETAINRLKAAIARGDNQFIFPTLDELNDPIENEIKEPDNSSDRTFNNRRFKVGDETLTFINGILSAIYSPKYGFYLHSTNGGEWWQLPDGDKQLDNEEFFGELARRGACTINQPNSTPDKMRDSLARGMEACLGKVQEHLNNHDLKAAMNEMGCYNLCAAALHDSCTAGFDTDTDDTSAEIEQIEKRMSAIVEEREGIYDALEKGEADDELSQEWIEYLEAELENLRGEYNKLWARLVELKSKVAKRR